MQDNYKEVLIVLIAGMTVFIILTGIVIFILLFYQKKRFQHRQQMVEMQNSVQQELLKTQLETQEYTFQQIAEELHDNVGQLLSSTKILLAITQRSLTDVPDTLLIASETVGKAIQDIRSLSKTLNKEWLEKFNIIDNLRSETDRINASRTILTNLYCAGTYIPLPPESQVMLFRIIQEALQNGIRHAGASVIDIHIKDIPGQIEVEILDNGKGMQNGNGKAEGIGLLTMRHRTRLLNGAIHWESSANKGTRVLIHIPFQKHNT